MLDDTPRDIPELRAIFSRLAVRCHDDQCAICPIRDGKDFFGRIALPDEDAAAQALQEQHRGEVVERGGDGNSPFVRRRASTPQAATRGYPRMHADERNLAIPRTGKAGR